MFFLNHPVATKFIEYHYMSGIGLGGGQACMVKNRGNKTIKSVVSKFPITVVDQRTALG